MTLVELCFFTTALHLFLQWFLYFLIQESIFRDKKSLRYYQIGTKLNRKDHGSIVEVEYTNVDVYQLEMLTPSVKVIYQVCSFFLMVILYTVFLIYLYKFYSESYLKNLSGRFLSEAEERLTGVVIYITISFMALCVFWNHFIEKVRIGKILKKAGRKGGVLISEGAIEGDLKTLYEKGDILGYGPGRVK